MKQTYGLILVSVTISFILNVTPLFAQWEQSNGPYGGVINSVACAGDVMLAGTNSGLFRSTNYGANWLPVLMAKDGGPSTIYSLEVNAGMTFAGTSNGFYLSSDSGATWSYVSGGLWLNVPVPVFAVQGDLIVFYSQNQVVVDTSSDFHWGNSALGYYYFSNVGLSPDTVVHCAAIAGHSVFLGTNLGVRFSADSGKAWTRCDSGLACVDITALASSAGIVLAGTDSGGVFRSTNDGGTWTQSSSGLTVSSVRSLVTYGNDVYAGTNGGGVFVSSNHGSTWKSIDSGLTNQVVNSLAFDNSSVIAGTDGNGVFQFNASWTPISSGISADTVNALLSTPGYLFAGTSNGGAYRSTDNGMNWSAVNSGLTCLHVDALLSTSAGIFAATFGGGVFLSTNEGETWVPRNNGIVRRFIASLTVSGSNILAGTRFQNTNVRNLSYLADSGMIYLSTDYGKNWTPADSGLFAVYALASTGSKAFAGSWQGVGISTDNGMHWASDTTWPKDGNALSAPLIPITFDVSGNDIFAGTQDRGIYMSTDGGGTWESVNSELYQVAAITTSGNNTFASAFFASIMPGQGVFQSNLDSLSSWTPDDSGFTYRFLPLSFIPPVVIALAASGNYLFAGTCGLGVWRVPLSRATGIEESNSALATRFHLDQNYPNPFNPTTNIEFRISNVGLVTLKVYDVLGQLVKTLVDKVEQPGSYEVEFNGSGLASGVYFYRLQSGNYTKTMKLMVLK